MSSVSETLASGLDWLSLSLASIRRRQRERNTETGRDNSASNRGVSRAADGDGDADNGTKASDAVARESFMQLLVSHGISPEEFRALLISGLAKGDGTPTDLAAAYQNVPSRVAVNTLS